MDYTKNYRLSKPSYNDDVDVQVLNNNMDILDNNLQSTTNKLMEYLPLTGGTMKGDIKLPYNTWAGLHSTRPETDERLNDVLCFANTTFNSNSLASVVLRSNRFVYYTPSDKALRVDDTGAFYDGDAIIRDSYTNIGWHSGYVKLSTGLCIQWGYVNPSGATGNVQHVTFKTPMLNPQYAVLSSRSFGTGNKSGNFEGRWGSASFNLTTTGFDLVCAEPNAYGHTEFWLAIGRYK